MSDPVRPITDEDLEAARVREQAEVEGKRFAWAQVEEAERQLLHYRELYAQAKRRREAAPEGITMKQLLALDLEVERRSIDVRESRLHYENIVVANGWARP